MLFFISIFIYINKKIENFTTDESPNQNINVGINFQSGISGISQTGTINFKTPFSEPPIVFAQILGSSSNAQNVYSVQIFNITDISFDYSKTKAYNSTQTSSHSSNTEYNIPKIDASTTEHFMWFAFR